MPRVAVISHLYPSAAAPQTGRFIHHHVRSLRQAGVDARVIAPVPWVPPGLARLRPRWRAHADTALEPTEYEGVPVRRLPYFTPPRPLHVVGAWSLANALARSWNELHPDFDCDLIHAHTLTPDGLAAHLQAADLVVLGEGSARAQLEGVARDCGVTSSVHFRGRVAHDEVALHLRAADVFVLPSHAEGMPNALLEAMAAGLPCIATSVGGIPEIVEPGVNGLLIPLRSRSAIASSLLWLHQEPRFARKLGVAAASTIRERLSWEANARQHLRLYQELTSRSPAHDSARPTRTAPPLRVTA